MLINFLVTDLVIASALAALLVIRLAFYYWMDRWAGKGALALRKFIVIQRRQFDDYLQETVNLYLPPVDPYDKMRDELIHEAVPRARKSWEAWSAPLEANLDRAAACCRPWGQSQNRLDWILVNPFRWLVFRWRINAAKRRFNLAKIEEPVQKVRAQIEDLPKTINSDLLESLDRCNRITAAADELGKAGFPPTDYRQERDEAEQWRMAIAGLQKTLAEAHPEQHAHKTETAKIYRESIKLRADTAGALPILQDLTGRFASGKKLLEAIDGLLIGVDAHAATVPAWLVEHDQLLDAIQNAHNRRDTLERQMRAPSRAMLPGWQVELASLKNDLPGLAARLQGITAPAAEIEKAASAALEMLKRQDERMQRLSNGQQFQIAWSTSRETYQRLHDAVQPFAMKTASLAERSLADKAREMKGCLAETENLKKDLDTFERIQGQAMDLFKKYAQASGASLDAPLKQLEDWTGSFPFHPVNLPKDLQAIPDRRKDFIEFSRVLLDAKNVDETMLNKPFLEGLEKALRGMERLRLELPAIMKKAEQRLADVRKAHDEAADMISADFTPLIGRVNSPSSLQNTTEALSGFQQRQNALRSLLEQAKDSKAESGVSVETVRNEARAWQSQVRAALVEIAREQAKANQTLEADYRGEAKGFRTVERKRQPGRWQKAASVIEWLDDPKQALRSPAGDAKLSLWIAYLNDLLARSCDLQAALDSLQESFIVPQCSDEPHLFGSRITFEPSTVFHPMTVRIWDGRSDHLKGMGVLVGQNMVITSARAVLGAVDGPLPVEKPDLIFHPLKVDFPFIHEPHLLSRQLTGLLWLWGPELPGSSCDLACLKLMGELPAGTAVAPISEDGAYSGHACRITGFPPGFNASLQVHGQVGVQLNDGTYLIDCHASPRKPGPGFLGAPVWDDHLQCLIGILTGTGEGQNLANAVMLPVNKSTFPEPAVFTNVLRPAAETRAQVRIRLAGDAQVQFYRGSNKSFSPEVFLPALADVLREDASRIRVTGLTGDINPLTVDLPVAAASRLAAMLCNKDLRLYYMGIEPQKSQEINLLRPAGPQ